MAATACSPALAQTGAPGAAVYRCPGPPVLYTDALSAQEAKDKGCRIIEGTPITVIQGRTPAAPRSSNAPPSANTAARPADSRIDPEAQRARDSDSRRILEGELRRAEEQLAELKREYNNGEPERLGNERNYQKYLDRTAELKSGVARKESDVAAIKRELAKLPP
jgi:predicted lipid-binding transport protein (Tim44 family)